jgi:hypothetical protein
MERGRAGNPSGLAITIVVPALPMPKLKPEPKLELEQEQGLCYRYLSIISIFFSTCT